MAARDIAKKPRIFEIVKTLSALPAKPAIIAPTIITDEWCVQRWSYTPHNIITNKN